MTDQEPDFIQEIPAQSYWDGLVQYLAQLPTPRGILPGEQQLLPAIEAFPLVREVSAGYISQFQSSATSELVLSPSEPEVWVSSSQPQITPSHHSPELGDINAVSTDIAWPCFETSEDSNFPVVLFTPSQDRLSSDQSPLLPSETATPELSSFPSGAPPDALQNVSGNPDAASLGPVLQMGFITTSKNRDVSIGGAPKKR
jgi:hypothetical protein